MSLPHGTPEEGAQVPVQVSFPSLGWAGVGTWGRAGDSASPRTAAWPGPWHTAGSDQMPTSTSGLDGPRAPAASGRDSRILRLLPRGHQGRLRAERGWRELSTCPPSPTEGPSRARLRARGRRACRGGGRRSSQAFWEAGALLLRSWASRFPEASLPWMSAVRSTLPGSGQGAPSQIPGQEQPLGRGLRRHVA